MKVAHFTAPKKLEIVDLPPPRLNRPDAVLLRVDRVGVCGSDVHYYLEGRIGDRALVYPATVGHECAGTVVEVGAEVDRLLPGQRVAVDPAIVCGTCDQCRAGRSNTCRNLTFMGCPGEALGAVAELRVVPAENCFPIPAGMTLDEAALVEPLSVGLHAVRLAELPPAARIAILGAGPIGLERAALCEGRRRLHRLRDRPLGRAAGRRPKVRGRLGRQCDARRGRRRHSAKGAAGLGRGVRVFRRSAVRR